jgi:hypothetical protein
MKVIITTVIAEAQVVLPHGEKNGYAIIGYIINRKLNRIAIPATAAGILLSKIPTIGISVVKT